MAKNTEQVINKCIHADKQTKEPHTCPYKAAIFFDEGTKCTCCEDCQQICRDDV